MSRIINVPQGKLVFSIDNTQKEILAVAGGRQPALAWLKQIAEHKELYCVDSGWNICCELGLVPQYICGDFDSIGSEQMLIARQKGIGLYQYPREKDATDFQLLLGLLSQKAPLIVTGIFGGRADHLYSNIFSLLHYKQINKAPVLMADEQELLIPLEAGENLRFSPNVAIEALSLLPLAACSEVSFKGVKWPLSYAPLLLSNPYAVSNEMAGAEAEFICHQGCSALYIKTKEC